MITLPSGRRRITTVALTLGLAASCFLPSEPAERITFELRFTSPLRVPLGQVIRPGITVKVGDQALAHPRLRLESVNRAFVRVDPSGEELVGVARGVTSVRVTYQGTTGAVDTTFDVRAVVSRVTVSPANITVRELDATVQLTAIADSTLLVAPNAFSWSSENAAIASVSATGLVTVLNEGNVRIKATLDDVEGQARFDILQAASVVSVLPELDTLRWVGSSTRFFGVARDSMGALLRNAKVAWSSSNPSVVSIDATGLARAESAGTAGIIGRVGLAADTATLVVKQVVRLLITSPSLDTLTAIADTGRVMVIARDSAGADIPDPVLDGWTSADPAIATVDANGLVTAHANGIVLVTVTSGVESAFATFLVRQVVTQAHIVEDVVTLDGAGATAQLTGVAVDRNGYPVPNAGGIEWRSHFGLVATVDANGVVTAQGNGRTSVSMFVAGQSDVAIVTVTGAPQELIAFESFNGIEAMRADGALRTVLIPNNPYCFGYYYSYSCPSTDPAWSPDGTKLAYAYTLYDYGPCYYGCPDVYTSWPDGSDATSLTGGIGTFNSDPAWSPDGTRIAFASNRHGGNASIYVMNADRTNVRRVVTAQSFNPKWSPDGSKIVFETGDIVVVNADGSGVVNLTSGSPNDFHPTWSPDGLEIAFARFESGNQSIWVMNANGSGLRNLTGGVAFPDAPDYTHEVTPAWSPDGSRIAFASYHCFNRIDEYGNEFQVCNPAALFTVNRDGTGLQALNAEGVNPAWHAAGSLSPAAPFTPSRTTGTRR